jgi:TrmH family RNA methyltransferase
MISKAVLKSINALKLKKYRTIERKFIVEGIKSVNEVISEDWDVEMLLTTAQSRSQLLDHRSIEIVDAGVLKSIAQLRTNEDCLAVVHMKPEPKNLKITDSKPNIVLDGIQDPGNFGTIIRSLDWFGYQHVICSSDTVDFYNTKTVAATMGSFTRIVPHYVDLGELLRENPLPVYGMDMNGNALVDTEFKSPCFIILGNEAQGIRNQTAGFISHHISIPGSGNAESLNVSIANGILLYHLANL